MAVHGVRFRAAGGGSPIIFTTTQGARILDLLEAHGVPADRQVKKLGWARNSFGQL